MTATGLPCCAAGQADPYQFRGGHAGLLIGAAAMRPI
jgi:hypothetical protein